MIQINKQPGQKVLDLGCGDNPHPQADVAVDSRPLGCVHFVVDMEQPLPMRDEEWDCVISQYSLEHVTYVKLPQLIGEIHRITKVGGKLVLLLPNTEAQMRWIQSHPNGWKDKGTFFEQCSELLFGSLDYPENSHKAFLSPTIIHELLMHAGFCDITTAPWGEAETDMVVTATKLAMRTDGMLTAIQKDVQDRHDKAFESVTLEAKKIPAPEGFKTIETEAIKAMETPPANELYDLHYWNGGGKVGGYAREGYRDFAAHEVTFQHIMMRRPQSVLELGAARGYIGKRLEDAGVDYCGLEVSEHCYLTRASDNIVTQDLCMSPWQTSHSHFDLAFSIAVFEHIPERFLPGILDELKRTTMRGLHGIDFGGKDDGFDKTHCTLRPFSWWRQVFDAAGLQSHEIVDKEELEAGAILPQVLKGDGKVKLNLGCGLIMFRHGWCNIDHQDLGAFAKHDQSQFIRHDLRTGIPFNPGCVDLISIGHLLECLTYDEAFKLLRECRRVIKPDGLMRIQGVSAPMLLETWQHGEMHQYDQFSKAVADAKTQMRKLHELLNAGHQSTWDVETLNEALADSQFVESGTDYCFRGSAVTEHEKQMRRETIDTEPCRSFYVNAVPKIA